MKKIGEFNGHEFYAQKKGDMEYMTTERSEEEIRSFDLFWDNWLGTFKPGGYLLINKEVCKVLFSAGWNARSDVFSPKVGK